MSNEPKKKKKVKPETASDAVESKDDKELGDEDLENVSGGTAATVSPALRDALNKAGSVGRA